MIKTGGENSYFAPGATYPRYAIAKISEIPVSVDAISNIHLELYWDSGQ
ncbi:hypothetical protein AVEN_103336-1, partial [Araneus ventricosus]